MTPPYDVRPATEFDLKALMKLIESTFGNKANFLRSDDIVLLNSIGSEDKMDEIIYAGKTIGIRRYDLIKRKWILKLNGFGLSLLQDKIERGWVKVDKIAAEKIKEGANVLIPGIIELDQDIKSGDYIAILDENNRIIAGGIARINATKIREINKGTFAKNYCTVKDKFSPKIIKRTWKEVAKLNAQNIEQLEKNAIGFIKTVVKKYNAPVFVSFSGGKDSLVTLSLVSKALPKHSFKVLFVDTGLEFPETVEYVKGCMKFFNLERDFIFEKVDEKKFWEAFKKFGPPSRDFRYCCKIIKLAPVRKVLAGFDGKNERIISFVGQRRYESFIRTQGEVWQNQYITNQINASPIQNWNALMIWLYIFLHDLPYNKLYDSGYDRIGCWLCPSSDMAHFEIIKNTHPQLYKKLIDNLQEWRRDYQLPEIVLNMGLWRFHYLPKKIKNLISDIEIPMIDKNIITELNVKNTSSCRSIPPTITGKIKLELDLEALNKSLTLVGKSIYYKRHNFIYINSDNGINAFIYENGDFRIILYNRNIDNKELNEYVKLFFGTILRTYECAKCELCVFECPTNAITISEYSLIVDAAKCIRCNKCFSVCPIVNIVERNQINDIQKRIVIESSEKT